MCIINLYLADNTLKMKNIFWALLLLIAYSNPVKSQIKWENPLLQSEKVIQGQAVSQLIGANYLRLPNQIKDAVRSEVWALAQNTAGLYVEFKTTARKITVRYTTNGMRAMNHMPATGVSGLDLYINDGKTWKWTAAKYSFKDTVTYNFNNIPKQAGTYRLYLPLYSGVNWMEIGVDEIESFTFVKPNASLPVIVYGSSIAQGGCASRPGLAWPAIFERKINTPVINLGFSGNGKLEQPIIEVMANTPAKLFILDCIPNMGDKDAFPEEELRKRVFNAVNYLQKQQAKTPILLVEHSGGNEGEFLDEALNEQFRRTSKILNKLYQELLKQGKKNVYLLTTKEIGFTTESTVDGSHPNDLGMMQNANAVEKAYKKIFK